MKKAVILHNIRSNENVGSIFRTSDASGVDKIFLVGLTPCPNDRFGRVNGGLVKASLGAEKSVAYEYVEDFKKLIERLKGEGFNIVAVEQGSTAVDYRDIKSILKDKNAFVFGNEVGGVPKEDLALCDALVEIPMLGKKESLNVSVTLGIILFSTI